MKTCQGLHKPDFHNSGKKPTSCLLGYSSFQNYTKINFYCLSFLVYGISYNNHRNKKKIELCKTGYNYHFLQENSVHGLAMYI